MKTVIAIMILVAASLATIPAAQARGKSGSYSKHYNSGYSSNHSVRGHVRKNGSYVRPHRATNRNGTKLDNYSTKGNVNPYTGKPGMIDPYRK